MAELKYSTVPGKVSGLLDKIRSVGVPPKATNAWLKSIGFKSSNDATLLPVVKLVGLADGSGVPTKLWKEYRGKNHKAVLAGGIKNGYSRLFETYPRAWECSKEDLGHFFSTKSDSGQQVIDLAVRTFQNLCAKADFSSEPARRDSAHARDLEKPDVQRQQISPSLHIDVQIHISPESSSEQIDKIFESMAKHLNFDERDR